MLPSPQRLSRSRVSVLLADPAIKVIFNRLGTLKYLNNLNSGTFGFTVVTGSKQQKRAVARNKIRRQLYSLVRQFPYNSFAGMLYVSKNAYEMTYAELRQYLNALLGKI
jgi:ribonuclease P protein component